MRATGYATQHAKASRPTWLGFGPALRLPTQAKPRRLPSPWRPRGRRAAGTRRRRRHEHDGADHQAGDRARGRLAAVVLVQRAAHVLEATHVRCQRRPVGPLAPGLALEGPALLSLRPFEELLGAHVAAGGGAGREGGERDEAVRKHGGADAWRPARRCGAASMLLGGTSHAGAADWRCWDAPICESAATDLQEPLASVLLDASFLTLNASAALRARQCQTAAHSTSAKLDLDIADAYYRLANAGDATLSLLKNATRVVDNCAARLDAIVVERCAAAVARCVEPHTTILVNLKPVRSTGRTTSTATRSRRRTCAALACAPRRRADAGAAARRSSTSSASSPAARSRAARATWPSRHAP